MNIELRGIHKRFGTIHANDDINLTFGERQIIGILGENGAGKSTLMKILSGLQFADDGEIWIDGERVKYNDPRAAISHRIGMLQQDPLDVSTFTALENFMYGMQPGFILNRRKAQEQLNSLTRRFGFELDPDVPIASLSIAQRQQLEIIRLLALGVHTLILDEPTTGISAKQKEILFDALRHLAKNEGALVLLVSHKLEDVISLCDKVYVLRAGRVVGSRNMPAIPAELVKMMFGEEIKPQTRAMVDLNHSPDILRVENITIQERRVTVENLSLNVRASEVVGFAGLDGSGQELVMRAIVGLKHTSRGRVCVSEKDMTHKDYRTFMKEGVTFCATGRIEEGLIAGLTLVEHMALVQDKNIRIDWERARRHMDTQIERYDVRGQSSNRVEELSGGNQQRVLMTLLPESSVVLVMENPTRGLDADSAHWIWEQLLDRRNIGTCIVFSSPDVDELIDYSDRIFVFYAGHVVEVPDVYRTNTLELGQLIAGHFEDANYTELA